MKRLALALAAAALLSGAAAMAGVEKWVDPDGGVHYGDQPPAGTASQPVDLRPNVIETGKVAAPPVGAQQPAQPAAPVQPIPSAATEPRKDIQSYIEQCRRNHGVDCETEARQMIDGPAPVIFPGDPAVFPRPDVKPPPPGLPLKFQIKP